MDLVSLTSWLSPNIVEAGMVTTGRFANDVGQDEVGMTLTFKEAADGSYMAMILNDAAPIPDHPTANHIAVSRRMMRFSNLSRLHDYFESFTHSQAISVLKRALDANERVALYLRSFELSAVVVNDVADSLRLYPGRAECATVPRTNDKEFQKLVASMFDGPIIALSNRADSIHSSVIPELVCASDWQDVIESFVRNATPIILLIAEPSQGVLTELELIIRCKKCEQTIIVRAAAPKLITGLTDSEGVKRNAIARDRWQSTLAAFPHQFDLNGIDGRLRDLIVKMRREAPPQGEGTLVIPANYGPPTPLASAAAKEADGWLHQAMQKHMMGEILEAEDLVYQTAVVSYFAHADELRVMAYFILGKLAMDLGRVDESRPLFEWTKKLAARLNQADWVEVADRKLEYLMQDNQRGK
jgi:hypothetical protein